METAPRGRILNFSRSGSTSRKAVVSSSQARVPTEMIEPSRASVTRLIPASLRTPSAQRGAVSSSDPKRSSSSARNSMNTKQYDSVVRGIESLGFDKDARR